MEEGQHGTICDNNQVGGKEMNNPPTLCSEAELSNNTEDDSAKREGTMIEPSSSNQFSTNDEEERLKLIVRSQYWGRELKGKTCRNVYTRMNVKAPLVITSQAVLYNTDGFWGCCPAHGKRVLELQEYHFFDACSECDWDLYLVGTWVSPSQSVHDFFLLPQNQNLVDIERNEHLNGWSFYGTCESGKIRSGINDLLQNLLRANEAIGYRYNHVHIDIMMDKAFDRETPRSRKLNNEKARAERNKNTDTVSHSCERQESSIATEATTSTEQDSPPSTDSKASNATKSFATKVIGAAPPIPRLIPNETVPYTMSVPHSMVNPLAGYHDATRWLGEPTHWNHERYPIPSHGGLIPSHSGHIASRIDHQEMYWQPARCTPVTGSISSHHSYWHHAPYTTGTQQPYIHQQDMQMHPYTMGLHPTHHQVASEMYHYNLPFPDNQNSVGTHNTSKNYLGANLPMRKEIAEEYGVNFLSRPNHSTKVGQPFPFSPRAMSRSPSVSSTSHASTLLDPVEVSDVSSSKDPSMVPTNDSAVTQKSLVDATTSTELNSIPTSDQLLVTTVNEP